MKRIIELNNFFSELSPRNKYTAILLIPKSEPLKIPIDLGGKIRNLEGSVMWIMLSEETKKSIGNPKNYTYLGKCDDWKSMEDAEKYLERIEKRLLDYNDKDKNKSKK